VDFGQAKISDTIFLGQSLLLSTTVLNDRLCISILKVDVASTWVYWVFIKKEWAVVTEE